MPQRSRTPLIALLQGTRAIQKGKQKRVSASIERFDEPFTAQMDVYATHSILEVDLASLQHLVAHIKLGGSKTRAVHLGAFRGLQYSEQGTC